MIASTITAPKQTRISAPALPRQGKDYKGLVGIELEKIIDIGITKKGVFFFRYATPTGRGCSFVKRSRLMEAFADIQMERHNWTYKVFNVWLNAQAKLIRFNFFVLDRPGFAPIRERTTYAKFDDIIPHFLLWNNDRVDKKPQPVSFLREAWEGASQELKHYMDKDERRASLPPKLSEAIYSGLADKFKKQQKEQLERELRQKNLVFFPSEEDGEYFYRVCTIEKQYLGNVIISAEGKFFILSAAEGAGEHLVGGAAGAVRGLFLAMGLDA